ncbi:preprotein translocase subunit SecY [Buchnera aphidicola]|uniref:preprotein translocase subunit SecY n=1 Tax=Buchnera aphidicola TaxID=9 RepID=UPI00346487A3
MDKKIKSKFFNINKSLLELKNRIFFLCFMIFIFRVGSFIPVPGINITILTDFLQYQNSTIIDMINVFSGGSLGRASIFSLGIMPYISSSIIIQLLTLFSSRLSSIQKEGDFGKKIIDKYTRYLTLFISVLQAIGISTTLPNIPLIPDLVPHPGFSFYVISVISLCTGTVFLMWLAELITDYGIGNGISIIIFIGIISSLPSSIIQIIKQVSESNLSFFMLFCIFVFIISVIFLVVFVERSYRKITLNYPKQNRNYNTYVSQSTHLPLKINISGVMPAIFSSSIIIFPVTLLSWFGILNKYDWLFKFSIYLQPGHLLYIIIYSVLIVFFCFFYSNLTFNPRETAENLKRSGAFIPGIRPGEQTSKYISKIMYKITFIGSLYMMFICLVPDFMRVFMKVPFHFGGTSLLIVVVVIIDVVAQVQTLFISSQYSSILKKSNFNF